MAKVGFIKPKKVWTKRFKEEELSSIWTIFKELVSFKIGREIDWEKEHYSSFIYGNNAPVYPETDKWDDTEGVSPKQVKRIMQEIGFQGFRNLCYLFTEDNQQLVGYSYYDRESNSISWKEVLDYYIFSKESNLDISLGNLLQRDFFPNIPLENEVKIHMVKEVAWEEISRISEVIGDSYYPVSAEAVSSILKGETSLEALLNLVSLKPYKQGTLLTLDNIDYEKRVKELEREWVRKHSFIPKNKFLKLLPPENWDKDSFIIGLQKLYKTKNLNSLALKDQENFISLYKTFGHSLPKIAPYLMIKKSGVDLEGSNVLEVKKEWKSELYLLSSTEKNRAVDKLLGSLNRGVDLLLDINSIYYILVAIHKASNVDSLLKKDRLTIRDIEGLKEVGPFLDELEEAINLDYEDFTYLKKANLTPEALRKVQELYSKTCNLEVKNIPILSGNIGEYRYEVLEKKHIRGLVVGNLTGCCQTVTSAARTSVSYGAEHENSTFFVVYKDNNIVAQSWVWEIDGQITFDSIECVSSTHGTKVLECYEDYASEAIKEKGVDLITVGAYTRTGRLGSFESLTSGSYKVITDIASVYTDARAQYLIKEK